LPLLRSRTAFNHAMPDLSSPPLENTIMAETSFPKLAQFKKTADFTAYLRALNINLLCDERILSAAEGSPLARPLTLNTRTIGNRWCIHPMEGWDGTPTGEPTELTLRRWEHFGASGAKLIWGGEAFAVQTDARANPNQLGIVDDNYDRAQRGAESLLNRLLEAHRSAMGNTDDLLVGLQLTPSGRFC